MEVLLNQSAWIGKYLKWALKNSVRTKQFHGKVTWKNWFFCGFGLLKFFVTNVSHAHTHLTRSSAFCRKLLTWGHFDYDNFKVDFLKKNIIIGRTEIVISMSRNGLLKACARFIIERSEIRKKQHAFKSVHFECRMVLFYTIWEKSRL